MRTSLSREKISPDVLATCSSLRHLCQKVRNTVLTSLVLTKNYLQFRDMLIIILIDIGRPKITAAGYNSLYNFVPFRQGNLICNCGKILVKWRIRDMDIKKEREHIPGKFGSVMLEKN